MAVVTESESNNTKTIANVVTLGNTVTGSTSSTDDVDYYKVSLSANSVLKYTFSSGAPSGWNYKIYVETSLGAWLAAANIGKGYAGTLEVGIAQAGDYYVKVVADTGYYSGQYNLTLSQASGVASDYATLQNLNTTNAFPISFDHTYKGQAGFGWNTVCYRVTASSAGILSVDFTPPTLKTFDTLAVSIIDANGKVLASENTGMSQTVMTKVDAAGDYYIKVTGYGYDSGNYSLNAHLESTATASQTTLTTSTPLTGSLSAGGHGWYKVDLTAGTIYEFKVSGSASSGGTLTDPSLFLCDSNFRLLEGSDNLPIYTTSSSTSADPRVGFVAPTTGTYYLMVGGNGGSGSYTVSENTYALSSMIPNMLYLEGAPKERWNASSAVGTAVTLTYSFLTSATNGLSGFVAMDATQKEAVRNVLAMYSAVANITFTEISTPDSAQLRFGIADLSTVLGGTAGVAYHTTNSDGSYSKSTVYLDLNQTTITEGSYALEVLIHETGHALGLKHPGNYNGDTGVGDSPFMPLAFDNRKFEVMSYNNNLDTSIYHNTPQLFDIAAIQYLYGTNTSGSGQSRTYTFSNSTAFETALLSSGTNDTIDANNQTLNATIYLTAGTLSSIGVADKGSGTAQHNVLIPFGATVVAGIGGSGNDLIVGNDLANTLTGGTGNDSLDGSAGNDILTGGDGNDTLAGGPDNDAFVGFVSTDVVDGGSGTDSIQLNATATDLNSAADTQILNIEIIDASSAEAGVTLDLHLQTEAIGIIGSAFSDIITISIGGGSINGGAGNDTFLGVVAGTTIDGGSGTDTIPLTATNTALNSLGSGQLIGIEWVDGSNASAAITIDLHNQTTAIGIVGSTYNDVLTASAGGGAITGGAGNDTISGGADNDTVDGGTGIDVLQIQGVKSSFTITQTSTGFSVADNAGALGADALTNVERIQFTDTSVALDISGNGGKAYRLYQAAFNRTPDIAGLGWQMKALDGGASLLQISQNFMDSAEFTSLYGANISNTSLVTQLYNNVLHRTPQQFEVDFWVNILQTGQQTRNEVLMNFSESAENQAQVIGVIQNGMQYTFFA